MYSGLVKTDCCDSLLLIGQDAEKGEPVWVGYENLTAIVKIGTEIAFEGVQLDDMGYNTTKFDESLEAAEIFAKKVCEII